MDILQVILLALLQGLTEFLPISSSAHLLLPSKLLGWPDQGLAFDVAVHAGSLVAVVWYFRRDLWQLAIGTVGDLTDLVSKTDRIVQFSESSHFVAKLTLATLPIVVVGLASKPFIETHRWSVVAIACSTIGFGLLLGFADAWRRQDGGAAVDRSLPQPTYMHALLIGLAQCFALIPGTSRAGVTITCGLLLGLSRVESSRFAFMLAIPVIGASLTLITLDLLQAPDIEHLFELGVAFVLAAVSAFLCIAAFIRLIERIGMQPFVIYRVILGLALLGLAR